MPGPGSRRWASCISSRKAVRGRKRRSKRWTKPRSSYGTASSRGCALLWCQAMNLSKPELDVLLRHDFCAFIERCLYPLNPQTAFLFILHIELMAAKLDAVKRGEILRLIINVAPRRLKSIAATTAPGP